MELGLWIAAAAAVVVGLAGIVLPLIPGTPLLFAGLVMAAWLDDFSRVGTATVVVLAVMALLAWVVDFVAAALGVKRVGASWLAVAGAGLGALPGLILGPIAGAMLGEWLARKDRAQAARAGLAAGVAFIVAVAVKIGIAFAMLGVFAFAYFV
jgi:uncharacterized protein YqgC (DUF456 family)